MLVKRNDIEEETKFMMETCRSTSEKILLLILLGMRYNVYKPVMSLLFIRFYYLLLLTTLFPFYLFF